MPADTRVITTGDGQHLAVTVTGAGPPVLCLPGGPARAARYLDTLGGLDATRTLLFADARGSGGSHPAEPDTLTLARLVEDVGELITGLGLHTPVLLGHSFGARVALEYASEHPDAVRALVLITPPPMVASDALDTARADILSERETDPELTDAVEAARALPTARPRERAFLEAASMPLWYGRFDDAARAHLAGAREQVSVRTALSLRNSAHSWVHPELATVTVPVLIVAGGLDLLAPAAALHAIHTELPDSTFVEIPDAGHFPWLDDPELHAAAIEEFLTDLP